MSTSPLPPEAVEVQAGRFRKKPVEVRAVQWTGDNAAELTAFAGDRFEALTHPDLTEDPDATAAVLAAPHSTWELIYTDDWIVRDGDGGFTRCRADDFRETFDPAPEPLELTPIERAAAARSEHMSTCHEEACVDCMRELRTIRRIVKAVRPVIEGQLKERLAAAELVCDIFGAAGWSSPETERTKATEQAWQDWFAAYGNGVRTPDDVIGALAVRRDETRARALTAYRERIREQVLAGKFDVPPVAAASNPTDTATQTQMEG